MAYVCITKTEEGFCAVKKLIRFFANSKYYEIVEEGGEYYLLTLDNKKIKVRGFTINVDLVVVVAEETVGGWFCTDLNELK